MRMRSTVLLACCWLIAIVGCGCAIRGGELPETRLSQFDHSFAEAPYIHPKIVETLTTWLSDTGDQVVAINLLDAQDSNRYHGPIQVRSMGNKPPFVYTKTDDGEFWYRQIGRTAEGLYVLHIVEHGGGSGVYNSVLVVTIEPDRGLECNWNEREVLRKKNRLLLKKLGVISLGDRWNGEIRVEGSKLIIGKDEGWFSGAGSKGGGPLSKHPAERVLSLSRFEGRDK